jgi:saccharopine dehydrogenase (NADP+, L-glutamate forming)/spermidine synthase
LPAPEHNDNPFGYKFSWSPRGVVLASRNSAKFKENGEIVNIEGKNLFANPQVEEIEGLGKFEVYPNRDSTPYEEIYGLQEALTVKRGTYRNIGWCQTFKKLVDLGMIDETPREELKGITFKKMMAELIDCDVKDDVKAKVAEKIDLPVDHAVLGRFEWLGLFSDNKVSAINNRLDILSDRLQEKLVFADGEKDLLILRHKFIVENKDKTQDFITSTLIDFGIPFGDSSMARTVSLPMAIGTKLLAEGKLNATGVRIPNTPDLYLPILAELETLGIKMTELRKRI